MLWGGRYLLIAAVCTKTVLRRPCTRLRTDVCRTSSADGDAVGLPTEVAARPTALVKRVMNFIIKIYLV